MTLMVIHRLHAFSNAIRRTFVQHFTRFQLTVCSHGSSALAELVILDAPETVCRPVSVRTRCGWHYTALPGLPAGRELQGIGKGHGL